MRSLIAWHRCSVNLSNTRVVPKDWKDTNVTPIFKKRAKWGPGNKLPSINKIKMLQGHGVDYKG